MGWVVARINATIGVEWRTAANYTHSFSNGEVGRPNLLPVRSITVGVLSLKAPAISELWLTG